MNHSKAISSARPSDVSSKYSIYGDQPPVVLNQSILRMSDDKLRERIRSNFVTKYRQEARPLQVESVLSVARGQTTFLLAGTGYGKTRIAESFRSLFSLKSRAIIVILNPLDALGDNQVLEKSIDGLKAVNLTALNFTSEVACYIEKGVDSFIYLSPEIFLTHRTWQKIYNSVWFRRRLVLKVIDEAHMIYTWGLVDSGKGKHMSTVKKEQDGGKFRLSWGNLCLHLMATRNSPLLMMSATCPHTHFTRILENLSLERDDVTVFKGELGRPEITILRITTASMSSLDFLKAHFAKRTEIPDVEVVPTLIYSGSRNGTMKTLRVLNQARGAEGDEFNPNSTFAQRYHSCSGDETKMDRMEAYTMKKFPVCACTSALGLGQNWTHTKITVQLGRAGVPEITQVVGRVGRNREPGLAIIYLEENRRGGLNCPQDFEGLEEQTDDQMMDALKSTFICMRIALVLANTTGFIPMYKEHESVIKEYERQREAGFPACDCNNCQPEKAAILMRNLNLLRISNFEEGLKNPESLDRNKNYSREGMQAHLEEIASERKKKSKKKDRPNKEGPEEALLDLTFELNAVFVDHFNSVYEGDAPFEPKVLFDDYHLELIIEKLDQIISANDLSHVIGGDALLGGVDLLFQTITDWKSDGRGELHYNTMREKRERAQAESLITRARLEVQDNNRRIKYEMENAARQKRMMETSQKEEEHKRKAEELLMKKEKAANVKRQRMAKQTEDFQNRERNLRMIRWLQQGVQEGDLNAKEAEFQGSVIS